ncbi:ANTAR domain-containing protein [Streptomyces sp. NPDC050504]|uniref:ANTAR domain-containing protein n=1 Tax=Streptomyces sp. NPDC050504 TaxID=3365618 RepID=UPI0037BC87B1
MHQATGMISVRLGITPAIALLRLRAYAFAEERAVLEVARDVVARRLRFPLPGEQQSEGNEAGDRGGSDDDRGTGR